ncbi:tumor protein p53-inducible protein 13 isoform X2 [Pelobates fuscus]|uniref:tumor protein p53-inducible protein 13 isoform X2 n=1 Tax=Pelobates fuscus TaxID=191477 RepID=UPI002FE4E611
MWPVCAGFLLLLRAGSAGGALCDNGRFNLHMDLPGEFAYVCPEEHWPVPSKVLPSIATKHRQENSFCACMDTQIVYTSPIPNSGVHRPKWAKYGEYIYCPPQRWVHSLKRGAVAFLYHPCVHPELKEEFSLVARSCLYKHIITPLHSLSKDRPLALAAWSSTLEMSHIDLKEVRQWLQDNIYRDHENVMQNEGIYDYLLIQPSSRIVSDIYGTEVCPKSQLEMLRNSPKRGQWLKKLKKRSAASISGSLEVPAAPLVQDGEKLSQNASVTSNVQAANITKIQPGIPLVPTNGITDSPTPAMNVKEPVVLVSTPPVPNEERSNRYLVERREALDINNHMENRIPESEVQKNLTFLGNNLPDHNLGSISTENLQNTSEKRADFKDKTLQSPVNKEPDFSQDKEYINRTEKKAHNSMSEKTEETLTDHPLEPASASGSQSPVVAEGKQECKCEHEPSPFIPPKAQKRSGSGQQKTDLYVSTPRTEEASWAAASLIFLFVLLTVCVLYTKIHKKFRKSQSLYWGSGGGYVDTETVASVIKRRLKQGYSKRKKWIGRKKPPMLLYESLSESSD